MKVVRNHIYLNSELEYDTPRHWQLGGSRLTTSNENVATDYIELKDGQETRWPNIRKRVPKNVF